MVVLNCLQRTSLNFMHTYLKTSYYAANVGKVARTLKQSSA